MDTIGSCIDKLFTVNLKYHHKKDSLDKKNLEEQRIELIKEINTLLLKVHGSREIEFVKPQHKVY